MVKNTSFSLYPIHFSHCVISTCTTAFAPNSETNQLIKQTNCSFKGPLKLISEHGRRKKYEHEKKILSFEGGRALEQATQRGYWRLVLWKYSKPTQTLSCGTYCGQPALAGDWTRCLQGSLPTPMIL